MEYREKIELNYDGLTKSEQKIADYLMSYSDKFIYMTLSELSEGIGVGEATIVRFCHKLGYEGFQHLKFEISKSTMEMTHAVENSIVSTVRESIINVVENTAITLKPEAIAEAVRILKASQRITFIGVGASGIAALEAQNRFLRIGLYVHAVTDPHFQMMNAATAKPDDALVAISLSGSTTDIIETVKLARKNGCRVIALTNSPLSLLSKHADCIVQTAGKESLLTGGSLIAKISQLYAIDCLVTGYVQENEKEAKANREKTARSVIAKAE